MSVSTQKVWGTTTSLLLAPLFEMHRLIIAPMHRCSFHSHEHKHNAFYVLDGLLFIDSALSCTDRRETVSLSRGRTFTVAPGVWHQFRTEESGCIALEMYYCDPSDENAPVLSEDIIRHDVGC